MYNTTLSPDQDVREAKIPAIFNGIGQDLWHSTIPLAGGGGLLLRALYVIRSPVHTKAP